MASYELDLPASAGSFDETAYLLANPDVAEAVRNGTCDELMRPSTGLTSRNSPRP